MTEVNDFLTTAPDSPTADIGQRARSLAKRVLLFDGEYKEETFNFLLAKLGDYPPIKLLEALLDHYKEKRREITDRELPELLLEAGLDSITTEDGIKITRKEELSVKTLNQAGLSAYLEASGRGDEIKDILTLSKGEFTEELRDVLEDLGVSYQRDSKVHYQTLARIMREIREAGEPLPPEDVAIVSVFNRAKIKG